MCLCEREREKGIEWILSMSSGEENIGVWNTAKGNIWCECIREKRIEVC